MAELELQSFMRGLIRRNPGELEFHQAVQEVVETLVPFLRDHQTYREANILERMTEPDRIIIFRVCWQDDDNNIRTYRVQFNNAIGPYKGGLRFHKNVMLSVLKFFGFEQTLKNSLTGLPMGGAKGGSDFNPKGKSDSEVMRFCHSMMTELSRHIGEDVDIPAGDIGVGAREIAYLFGQYKRVNNRFAGTITGKGLAFGGSLVRREATGYGCVYFTNHMLEAKGDSLKGKICSVSGSGNVALYTVEKALDLGAKVVTLSDSSGFIYDPAGLDAEKLTFLKKLKEVRRGRISEYAGKFRCEFHEARNPWSVPCEVAFPCATQNEVDEQDAAMLIKNGIIAVGEGANMPCTLEATRAFLTANVLLGPSKAANAGGVAVSGLEQSQNALRLSWSRDEVCKRLQQIMSDIHTRCCQFGDDGNGNINYVKGANIAGFVKVADAMLAYGSV